MSTKPVSRREFLTKVAQGTAVVAAGAPLWAYLLQQEARAMPYALRPPGALADKDFNALCIKCGQCVNACPYDTLGLAETGDDLPIGTPYFKPREIPCYLCPDIPCMKACPTGALSPELKDINESRMGLAVIDVENCLSWLGLRCEICYRDCPIKGEAIVIEPHPRKISKHAMMVPMVKSDACTGCGICEKACPTQEAAIRILPHKLVQGKVGDHYRLGWKTKNEITQEFKPYEQAPTDAFGTPPNKTPGKDYLNKGDL